MTPPPERKDFERDLEQCQESHKKAVSNYVSVNLNYGLSAISDETEHHYGEINWNGHDELSFYVSIKTYKTDCMEENDNTVSCEDNFNFKVYMTGLFLYTIS